jgi:TetR/AcrR family transcriptional repressor of nem operon
MRVLQQLRAEATRERIVAAAARLFALKGYHDTKLEEVLKAARATTGAFFHHFLGKEDLGFAVIDRHMARRCRELEKIEAGLPPPRGAGPLEGLFRRLDAIGEMVRRRRQRKGGCIIGNLSTALSDTHEGFRRRLAKCFDEMALEFKPHLDVAAATRCPQNGVDTLELARYIVAIIEGAIMLARVHRDAHIMERQLDYLKQHLRELLSASPAGSLESHKTSSGRSVGP